MSSVNIKGGVVIFRVSVQPGRKRCLMPWVEGWAFVFCGRPEIQCACVTWARGHRRLTEIKGSIEPTHGSVCSDGRKLQSIDVLKFAQSTKAESGCPFHILAYIYSNLLDISTSYFIKILSYRERLDVDFQRTEKKCTFHLDFRGERVENKEN